MSFDIEQFRMTTRCNKCGGFAVADFDSGLWVCEEGCEYPIKVDDSERKNSNGTTEAGRQGREAPQHEEAD